MSGLYEFQKRLTPHFLSKLREAETKYLEDVNYLRKFSQQDWVQIELFYQRAVQDCDNDRMTLELCTDYPACAPNLLTAVQGPDDRIEWLEIAREAANRLERFEIEVAHLGNLAMTYRNVGRMEEAILSFEQLCEALEDREDVEEANALCMLGENYRVDGRYKEAIEAFERALAVAKDQSYILKSALYHNLGITSRNMGNIPLSVEHHETERRIAEEENDPAGLARAYFSLGIASYEQLQVGKALKYHTEALEITEREQFQDSAQSVYVYHVSDNTGRAELTYGVFTEGWQKFFRLPIFMNRGIAETAIGRYEHALRSLDRALKTAEDIGHKRFEAICWYRLGAIQYFLGKYEKALQYYKKSLALAEKDAKARRAKGFALAGLGRIHLTRAYLDVSHNDLGFNELSEAFGIAIEIEEPRDIQEWGADLAEAYLYAGKLDDVQSTIDQVIEQTDRHNIVENRYRVVALHGLIQARRGEQVKSVRSLLEEALAITDELLAQTPDLFAAQYIRGLALSGLAILSKGNTRSTCLAQAQEAYRDARKICDARGVINDASRLLDALQSLDPEDQLAPVRALLK